MKLVILFFILASVLSEDHLPDYFGVKDSKGKWIVCTEEASRECVEKLEDPEAGCMFRKVLAIGNPRDNEYVNMSRDDADLEPGRNSTRCVTDD